MSSERDVTRIVRSWLEEGATALPDRVLDNVLDLVPATRQRRAAWPARRFADMNNLVRIAIAAAAVVVVAFVGINLLPGSGPGGPGATPTPGPTTTPTAPVPTATPGPAPVQLQAGSGTPIVIVVAPFGWQSQGWVLLKNDANPPNGAAFALWDVRNTYADPCGHVDRDPAIGPTAADLATALTEIPNTTSTGPEAVTIGGRDALYVELVVDRTIPCPAGSFYVWHGLDVSNDFRFIQGVNETDRCWVVDVAGERVLIVNEFHPGPTEADRAALQAMIDSLQFE